jgi:tight adherence protein B
VTLTVAVVTPLCAAIVANAAIRRARQPRMWWSQHGPTDTPKAASALSRDDVLLLVGACCAGWLIARVIGVAIGLAIAWGIRRVRARRAQVLPPIVVQERAADAIGALAAAVRSGASLAQAIRYAATEAAPPVSDELGQIVADLDTGVALDDALAAWATRRRSTDTDLLVGALELHRRSGGDLPAVLDQVAATIRDRVSIAREVRSLTAQARLSAWILGLLPIGFFGFLWITSRHDIEGALSTPIGLVCVVLGLALEGGAFLWIRSLLEVG